MKLQVISFVRDRKNPPERLEVASLILAVALAFYGIMRYSKNIYHEVGDYISSKPFETEILSHQV